MASLWTGFLQNIRPESMKMAAKLLVPPQWFDGQKDYMTILSSLANRSSSIWHCYNAIVNAFTTKSRVEDFLFVSLLFVFSQISSLLLMKRNHLTAFSFWDKSGLDFKVDCQRVLVEWKGTFTSRSIFLGSNYHSILVEIYIIFLAWLN